MFKKKFSWEFHLGWALYLFFIFGTTAGFIKKYEINDLTQSIIWFLLLINWCVWFITWIISYINYDNLKDAQKRNEKYTEVFFAYREKEKCINKSAYSLFTELNQIKGYLHAEFGDKYFEMFPKLEATIQACTKQYNQELSEAKRKFGTAENKINDFYSENSAGSAALRENIKTERE